MKKLLLILALCAVAGSASAQKRITVAELRDKIAGAWLGQMVGNMYGLPFENKFIEKEGDEALFPFGYSKSLVKMEQYDGAFSDDDTDVEYLYLMLMEKYGCEPTFAQMREGWMHHIRDRVWLANRAALGLMHYGFTPPFTGDKRYNPHWYQIDPQLINEIWSYTAPGMVRYAAEKSAWAARITSDDWAIAPTIHYGAMYSAAFFEKNIKKLVLDALKYLPADDRYARTVRHMVALYEKYPDNWQAARAEMARTCYVDEPAMTKTIWNANLNGACGILTLLYGNGDLQRTMDLGCAMGFDADNQTATVGGILGVLYGAKSLPGQLTMPFDHWTKPFNDRYINITRFDMPDASIEDMIDRTVEMAIRIVCAKGGKVTGTGGKRVLTINTKASFEAPLEFCVGPAPRIETGAEVDYSFACATNKNCIWSLVKGELPAGLKFDNGRLTGTTTAGQGKYPVTLSLSNGKEHIEKDFEIVVRGRNIAPEAKNILANVAKTNKDVLYKCWITFGHPMYADGVEVLNDGVLGGEGSVFYTLAAEQCLPKIDFLGYEWNERRTVNAVALHMGCMEEFGGWFSSLSIQYRGADGRWYDVGGYRPTPALPASDTVFIQPHFVEYLFEFDPVETDAVRILTDDAVLIHWNKDTKNTSAFLSVTELSVYEK
ncbi:MAG: ADP-ribosylglycohydrolase family protein [Alistipes sp.]|nr:ADP-ribosylglycohydrolase family protein [Alistipes sp.]